MTAQTGVAPGANEPTAGASAAPGQPGPGGISGGGAGDPGRPPPPPSTGGGSDRRQRHWTMAERLLAVLAAGLSVVAGGLGIWGAQATSERDDLETTADSIAEERDQLGDELSSAQERIDELETAATSTTTTTTSDITPTGGAPGEVTPGSAGMFRETGDSPVTFARGYGIDLDTRDTNWGVQNWSGDIKLGKDGSDLSLSLPSDRVALVDQVATYDHCEAQTVLQGSLSAEQTVVGQQFCVRTGEDRWAYVKILGLDPGRETVTLHIVVWSLENE